MLNVPAYVIRLESLRPLLLQFGRQRHWETRSYQWDGSSSTSMKERLSSVSSYYGQTAVDIAAAKQAVRLTPESLLYTGKNSSKNYLLKSAQYLHREIPVRVAQRIMGFRSLPFIIGCNPTIMSVHDLYMSAFRQLTQLNPIETSEDEEKFSQVLRTLLDEHSQVLGMLARGFKECIDRISEPDLIRTFLDQTLTSRLGIRMLAEHHLALREEKPNCVGIIHTNMSLADVVKKQVEIVSGMVQLEYGCAPEVVVSGQTGIQFPYIPMPLEYILCELLKNAFRATMECHLSKAGQLPAVYVTLSSDGLDFWLRISDYAGGIPLDIEERIWDYHFSTPAANAVQAGWAESPSSNSSDQQVDSSHPALTNPPQVPPAGGTLQAPIRLAPQQNENLKLPSPVGPLTANQDTQLFSQFTKHEVVASIHGFGFGLPTSRAYAQFLGGSLRMETMRSLGTDFYLRLRHIDGPTHSFRI